MEAPTLHPASRVSLRPLAVHPEDGEFVVGRVDTGVFVSVPEIGARALGYLREGRSLAEVEAQLAAEDGSAVDVQAFAAELLELGFIAAVDEVPIHSTDRTHNHLPWLKPCHVRWLFSRPIAAAYAALLTIAAVTVTLHPDVLPRVQDFFWSPRLSLVMALNLLVGWLHAGGHELAHLVAARAEGIPSHIRAGTRLQYLVLQTDVSGAWSLPRPARYRIYLAGVLWDLMVASLLLLALAHAESPEPVAGLLRAWILVIAFGLLGEFAFYMRTDIYFVFQDLLHSRNLFHEAQRLLLHRLRKLFPKSSERPDPLEGFTHSGRRKVILYAGLLIAGTTLSLGRYLLIGIPILIELVTQAAEELVSGYRAHDATSIFDGGVALLVVVGMQAVFVAAFVQGHHRGLASVFATVTKNLIRHQPSHPDSALPDAPPVVAP